MFTTSQADDGAGFSSFPTMAQQFLCTVHSLLFQYCQNKNHKKSKLCRQVLNEFQREQAARPHAGIFPDTYIRRQRIHLSLMRQQHAFSLSTRFFPTSPLRIPLFPDKAGCCLGLFRSFYYSFKTKAKVGITSQRTQKNLPPCPPWSTNLPQLWPNDALTKWGQITCEGTSGRPLSASVVLKKKKTFVVFYTMECGGGKTPWKDLANCHLWEMNVESEGKSAKTRRPRRPTRTWTWTLSLHDLGRARGCCKAATARL